METVGTTVEWAAVILAALNVVQTVLLAAVASRAKRLEREVRNGGG